VEVQVKVAEGRTRRGGRTRRRRRRVEWFWTVWVMLAISVALLSLDSAGIYGLSSSSSLLPACETLARGELHNSWPCYTPTASPRPSSRGPPPPDPPLPYHHLLRFNLLSLPWSRALYVMYVRVPVRKNVCVCVCVCTMRIKLALR